MKKARIGMAVILVLFGSGTVLSFHNISDESSQNRDALKLLKDIHDEVVSLGKYPDQDFFKREFFVGEDDDDTNKDIHVAIVIYETDAEEKMTIQVTYMERTRSQPVVGIAKNVKSIKCTCKKEQIDIKHSGFSEKELKSVLKDILRAIHDKKKLLKEVTVLL